MTLPLTEGVLPTEHQEEAIRRLSEAMLRWLALSGNTVMTPNVTANIQIVPKGQSFSGGKRFAGAWIERKVPSFAFNSREIHRSFGSDATDIVHELSDSKQPRYNIYFNVVHTVDGAWNLDGQAMSNEELVDAIGRGAEAQLRNEL